MKIVNTRLTKGFMAISAPTESLPSPATLVLIKSGWGFLGVICRLSNVSRQLCPFPFRFSVKMCLFSCHLTAKDLFKAIQINFCFGCRIRESAMICSICLFCLVLALPGGDLVPRPIKIAAIFDEETNMRHDLMFVNAVKSVNKLRGLLRGVTLVGKTPSTFPLSQLVLRFQ